MSTPAARGVLEPRLGVVLPEGWHGVPLHPDSARRRAVEELVGTVVGRADDAALLRARLRERLSAAADDAAQGGAQLLVLSLMRSGGGVPLPASLVVTVVDTGGAEAAEHAVPQGDDVELTRLPGGWAARRVEERHDPSLVARVALAARDGSDGAEGLSTLAVDYWVRPDAERHVAVLAFSTPLVPLRAALLPLFDAVVSSLRWQEQVTEPPATAR